MIDGLQAPTPKLSDVQAALQNAIVLEHATIPPYLFALYSLAAGKNQEIGEIIFSVVMEEMLHLTLSSNVLNALQGSPNLDQPGFIPTYPGALPGGVESQLTVSLAPFSMAQLQTFLTIEEPADPLNFKALAAAADTITIGEFYGAIATSIAALPAGSFASPARHQVGPELMREAVIVTDTASALKAIKIIVDQGEGTSTSPEEVYGGQFAHYYRFNQIAKGHRLVKVAGQTDPGKAYAYSGAAIPFDASGVYAATVPAQGYPSGSAQAFANNNFNYTYTSLLKALHALFNGQANQPQMNACIGLMMSLKGQAKAMMSGIPDPSRLVGPTFQYQPVSPATP